MPQDMDRSDDDVFDEDPRPRRASIMLRRPTLVRTQTKELLRVCVDEETERYIQEKSKVTHPSTDLGAVYQEQPDSYVRRRSSYDVIPTEVKQEEESSGAEYDTDLETEKREATPDDRWGKTHYIQSCRKMGLNPVGSVLRGITTHKIQVRGRGLNERDILPISFALMDNTVVKSLVLEENRLGNKGAEYIALMLYENQTIERLNLAFNSIQSEGVRNLLEMLLENACITTLDLSGNHLTDADAYMFAEYIEETSTLERLTLSNNDFGDEAGIVLGPAIAVNESIRHLDLSWNKIRTTGGVSICRGLQANAVIKSINLAYNGLSNVGAAAMAQCLKVNDIVVDVDLTCNRIFDEGAAYLWQALTVNERLKYLRLSNNPLTTMGAITLLEALKKSGSSSLELVDMSSVHIYKNALDLLNEVRSIHPSFKFQYGGVVNSEGKFGGEEDGFSSKNPLTILRDYIAAENLRLVDLFKRFDKDGGGSISRQEFIHGLQSINVPLTQHQLDRLITMLDKDGDGEVDFGELVQGEKEHRRKMMRLKQDAVVKLSQKAKKLDIDGELKIPTTDPASRPKLLKRLTLQPK